MRYSCRPLKSILAALAPLRTQSGAMFGLDARISLGIFGALSIIAGAYTALNLSSIYAHSFSKELDETAKAIEAIHNDLEEDLHGALINNTDKNAFIALYDQEMIIEGRPRSRWLGPYIKTTTPIHDKFGEIRITKQGETVGQDCFPSAICYLWLVYDNVPLDVAEELNKTFDGTEELMDVKGRLQWQDGYDDSHVILWFRASRAMSGSGYY